MMNRPTAYHNVPALALIHSQDISDHLLLFYHKLKE